MTDEELREIDRKVIEAIGGEPFTRAREGWRPSVDLNHADEALTKSGLIDFPDESPHQELHITRDWDCWDCWCYVDGRYISGSGDTLALAICELILKAKGIK